MREKNAESRQQTSSTIDFPAFSTQNSTTEVANEQRPEV